MHFVEKYQDGTALGFFERDESGASVSEAKFYDYHETVARQQHPSVRGHVWPKVSSEYPERAVQHARIRTALITCYRVHAAEYFFVGADYPKTWERRESKVEAPERFSPPGTVGCFFGLTLEAALSEARHYSANPDGLLSDPSKVIVGHRTYFEDLLYLAPILPALWSILGLERTPTWEMYLRIMDPNTSNEVTDAIGMWARDNGYKGIVFPSARFGSRGKNSPEELFPVVNFVDLGSHVCEKGVAINLTLSALSQGLAPESVERSPEMVFSEPNLVVFDEAMVDGSDRPVFYVTYAMERSDYVQSLEDRESLKHQINLAHMGDEVVLTVDGPTFNLFHSAPRREG